MTGTADFRPRNGSPRGDRKCSIARTIDILSDAWAFLIIREAFFGARRFEGFRTALQLPKATLSARLKSLTRWGIFETVEYSSGTRRVEYRLTDAGLDLYPGLVALMQFGDRWLNKAKPPLVLIHRDCGKVCRPFLACSTCGDPVYAEDSRYRDGPGAGWERARSAKRSRRISDPASFVRGRPSSVSLTLRVIGDRWTFLVVRDAFVGSRTFERFQSNLGIASNILTDRLHRLVACGVFDRRAQEHCASRSEYRLTRMGKELFGPLALFMAWGDRWLSDEKPPVILTHAVCGSDFTPTLACDRCRAPVNARAMSYRLNYLAERYGAAGRRRERSV